MKILVALSLIFLISIIASSLVAADGYLHLLSKYPNALCLDGSPGGLYYWPGTGNHKSSVIFSQQGGGLCTSLKTCYQRSKTDLGSTKSDPPTQPDSELQGFLSRNCTINPHFCEFSVFYLRYCSGDLFSGSRDQPAQYQGTNLYFKGQNIRLAALAHIAEMSQQLKFTEFIYSGDSAGGLSTFVNSPSDITNVLFNAIPTLQKAAAIPLSGLFPMQPNLNGVPVIQILSMDLMKLANNTQNGNPDCMKAFPQDLQYLCVTPVVAYNYSKVPTFVSQSHTDQWQILCELTGELTENNSSEQCLAAPLYNPYNGCPATSFNADAGTYPFQSCTQQQMDPIIAYQQVALNIAKTNQGFQRPLNGVFMISCLTHVAAEQWLWAGTRIKGTRMRDAVWQWWNSLPNDRPTLEKILFGDYNEVKNSFNNVRSGTNDYFDCVRSGQKGTTFYECNPTCISPVPLKGNNNNFLTKTMKNPHSWDGKNIF
jgi:hypothetical protein